MGVIQPIPVTLSDLQHQAVTPKINLKVLGAQSLKIGADVIAVLGHTCL